MLRAIFLRMNPASSATIPPNTTCSRAPMSVAIRCTRGGLVRRSTCSGSPLVSPTGPLREEPHVSVAKLRPTQRTQGVPAPPPGVDGASEDHRPVGLERADTTRRQRVHLEAGRAQGPADRLRDFGGCSVLGAVRHEHPILVAHTSKLLPPSANAIRARCGSASVDNDAWRCEQSVDACRTRCGLPRTRVGISDGCSK